MRRPLNPTLVPVVDKNPENGCAIFALSAVTGLPMSTLLDQCRKHDPKVASRTGRGGYGTPILVYEKVLRALGYETERVYPEGRTRPRLGTFLAKYVKHQTAIVVVSTGRRSSHAIATRGMIVRDNGRHKWYTDVRYGWNGRTPTVLCATIVREIP